jgi:GTP-binding protein EngB required for normal cell division
VQYNELLSKFKLLSGVLKQPDNTEMDERLARLSKLIDEKIPDTLKKNAPPEYYELYTDFKALYGQFRNFVLYDELIGRNVVALGGGFSSGKSSFLNALDGENALPTDISPSTAVPTFIVNGEKHYAFGVNIFDAKIPIELRDIPKISHGFGEVRDENGELAAESVTLGHVIKSIFLASPKQSYTNLAFVDTPGFSKPDSDTYSAQTDEYISRSQLNSSSYIMLFVQADAGTLKDEDIRFIQSLRTETPKLFIVSKADVKSEHELNDIVAHIKSQLTLCGIAFMDVLTFSRNKPTEYDAKIIREILGIWNKAHEAPQFSRNFKKPFIHCREFYEKEIESERRRLEQLNISLTKLSGEEDETIAPLRKLVQSIQKDIAKLKAVSDELKELNREFFSELKNVCDKIGINMQEPSEADMYDDIPDPLKLLRDYKHAKGIKTNPETPELLKEAFSGAVPALDKTAGGSAHRDIVVQLLRSHCKVDKDKIHINDAVDTADAFKYGIQRLTGVLKKLNEEAMP